MCHLAVPSSLVLRPAPTRLNYRWFLGPGALNFYDNKMGV